MKKLIACLMILIMAFPKITILDVPGSSTGIRLEDILIVVLITVFFAFSNKQKDVFSSNKLRKIKKIMIIYFIFGILSCLYGYSMGYVGFFKSFLYLSRKIEYFLFIYLGYYYARYEKIEKMFVFLILFHFSISMLQSFGLVGSFKDGSYMSALTQGRITSTFNGSYEFGAFLLLLLPYFCTNILESKKKRNINFLCIIIITICIFISQSRSSLIVEAIIILLIMYDSGILKKKESIKKIALLSVLALPVIVIGLNNYSDRFKSLNMEGTKYIIKYAWANKNFNSYLKYNNWYGYADYTIYDISRMGYDASLYQRISHWFQLIDGLNIKTINWIIGLGNSVSGNSADGNYLRILAENGLVGLLVWIILLINMYNIFNEKSEFNYYKYSLITILLGALLIDLFEASKIMMVMWFIVGYVINKSEIGGNYELKECNNN